MTDAVVLISVTFASALLTGALYKYALARQVLDVPNERSAHTIPTPRGGGVAIVVSFIGTLLLLGARGLVSPPTVAALGGAGAVVALLGFIDDHRPLHPGWRLLAHFVAAAWGLAWLGGLAPLSVGRTVLHLGWAGHALAMVALVWLLNLYNFMDGIDGLAGLETVTASLVLAALSWIRGGDDIMLPATLGAASLGFLAWNWPPARIFMGDAGSGFLGLMIGLLAIRAGHGDPTMFWVWLILLGVFTMDATVTLLQRVHRRERASQAHSDHAYQHAARRHGHRSVTVAVGAINLFWLAPIALLVVIDRLPGAVALLIACAPLVWLAIRLKSPTLPRSARVTAPISVSINEAATPGGPSE